MHARLQGGQSRAYGPASLQYLHDSQPPSTPGSSCPFENRYFTWHQRRQVWAEGCGGVRVGGARSKLFPKNGVTVVFSGIVALIGAGVMIETAFPVWFVLIDFYPVMACWPVWADDATGETLDVALFVPSITVTEIAALNWRKPY